MANECFRCGISGDKAFLFSAVSEKGVVRVCRKCSFVENIPIIKHMKEKVEKRQTVHERLSRLSGIEIKKKEKSDILNGRKNTSEKDKDLIKIANENFKKSALVENPPWMIHNFHWVIMRKRRAKKLTQSQFAESIGESEEAIKMIEKGFLPKDYFLLVNKVEDYLGVRLLKESMVLKNEEKSFDKEANHVKNKFFQNIKKDEIKFDDITARNLTISDLKEMKKKKEEEIFNELGRSKTSISSAKVSSNEKKDNLSEEDKNLSQDEIDRILFGK